MCDTDRLRQSMRRAVHLVKRMHTRGIEPRSQAWEACMMPLHYVCDGDALPIRLNSFADQWPPSCKNLLLFFENYWMVLGRRAAAHPQAASRYAHAGNRAPVTSMCAELQAEVLRHRVSAISLISLPPCSGAAARGICVHAGGPHRLSTPTHKPLFLAWPNFEVGPKMASKGPKDT